MANLKIHLTFPEELITEPIIYNLGQEFGVVTNIRRADVSQKGGWVELGLNGSPAEIEKGVDYLKSLGVKVSPIEKDIIEG